MSDLKARLDRELATILPTDDARAAIDRRVVRRRRRRTVLLPTATLILTAGLVAGLTYAFSPDPAGTRDDKAGISLPVNQIAFTSYRDGRLMDIYLMNTDGTRAIRLTDSGAEDLLPAWSPDGSRIAFASTRSVGPPHTDGHIFIMNADGTEQRRLVFDLSSAGSPAWSPDGTKIAFAGCCRPGWDIYVINEDGTGLVQLTSDELFDSSPDWSPDGSRIVFGRDDDGTGPKLPSHGLYLISADGTGLRQLIRGYGAQPAWSPASTGIAFARFGDRRGIYLIEPRSGEEIRLTSGEDTEPAWSPDGTRIAFTSYRVNGEGDIFVMESDGSHQTQITDNPFGDYEPAWQPAPVGSTASKEEETSAEACAFPSVRPTYLPWLAPGQAIPRPEMEKWAEREDGIQTEPGYSILSWSNGDVTNPGTSRDIGSIALWRTTESVVSFPTDDEVPALPDGSTGRLHASEGGGADWSIVWGDSTPDVTGDDCSETTLVAYFPNLSKAEGKQEIIKIARSLVPAEDGSADLEPLVIQISAPRAEDGTYVSPRFQVSFLGTRIPLDAIETPGAELEYPVTESPIALPAGTSFIIEGEYRDAAVFELRHFRGDYVEEGACLVPTPLGQIPDRDGPTAFFIFAEWSDAAGGKAFRTDVVGAATSSEADGPETQLDGTFLGLVVCDEAA